MCNDFKTKLFRMLNDFIVYTGRRINVVAFLTCRIRGSIIGSGYEYVSTSVNTPNGAA